MMSSTHAITCVLTSTPILDGFSVAEHWIDDVRDPSGAQGVWRDRSLCEGESQRSIFCVLHR